MQMDYLRDPRYSVRNLSDAILKIPNLYQLLHQLGLFPERGISTTYVEIEAKEGTLNLIPVSQRGGPAPVKKKSTRNLRVMKTHFLQLDDRLVPSDLQNLPAFGTPQFFESFDAKLAERFFEIQRYYRQTHEFWKWGALRGNVYDADGTTVLYNCYTEMGESQASFDFKFGTTTSNEPLKASKAVRRHHARNLLGETMTYTVFLCSPEFMDNLTMHPFYKPFYEQQQAAGNPIIDDVEMFKVGQHIFIEHIGEATYLAEDGTSTTQRFIPENEAIGIPMGTSQVFQGYFAPGEMMSTVNMPGQSIYVSTKELDHGAGIEIHTESAPLFVVQKPRLVVRAWSSN